MSEPEEVLDLDTPPVGTPMRAWGWRQGLFLGAAVIGVVCILIAVLFWPQPRPVPIVVGLRQAPVSSWSVNRGEVSALPTSCGDDGIALLSGTTGQVVCRALDDGSERWATEVGDPRLWAHDEPVFLSLLEGTGLIQVVGGGTVSLLDSGTGAVRHVIERQSAPEDGFGPIPFFSSDKGTLFWVEPQADPVLAGRVTLSRLRGPDPAAVVWSTGVGGEALNAGWQSRAAVEHRGYLWLRDASWSATGHSMAVGLADGELPQWSLDLRDLTFQDSTVIGSTGSGLEARDLGSNRMLWQRSDWGERAMVMDGGVYLLNQSETVVLNPDTGQAAPPGRKVIAPVTRVDTRTGRELWRTEVPHSIDRLESIGQQLLAVPLGWSGPVDLELSALDPSDGSVVWTRDLGIASFGGVFMGEGHVIVSYSLHDEEAGERMYLTALDSETGATLWDTELEGYAFVVGQRLLTVSESKLQVYR